MSAERFSSPIPVGFPSTATSLPGLVTPSVTALRAHGDEPLASSYQPMQRSRASLIGLSFLEEVSRGFRDNGLL